MSHVSDNRIEIVIQGRWQDWEISKLSVFKRQNKLPIFAVLDGYGVSRITPWKRNLVVTSIESVISGFMRGDPGFNLRGGGILYHAIGAGDVGWGASPPGPTIGLTTLEAEYYRKLIRIVWKYYLTEDAGTFSDNSAVLNVVYDDTRAEALPTDLIGLNIRIDSGVASGDERIIVGYDPAVSPKKLYLSEDLSALPVAADDYTIFKRSSSVTNQVMVATPFYPGDPGANGTFREQGLFGGTATGTTDSGFMINVIRHEPKVKDAFTGFIRRIRLTFTKL